ncbi:CRM-domain containing factor cfm9, mitochondrial [Asimina triloba]
MVKVRSVNEGYFSSVLPFGDVVGSRFMSTTRGRSMRSKVEKRMRRETGKTLREIRRAKKLRKKLMTDEERLIYNLRRAKKKVALLLQKLKKYELPELPSPRHDPELLTLEQLQAYKKIGFRNRNYVPVGVRGVFGGVVQNMHLHWKFHETVQVCCDNFPKEKIKEMATMLARLSGGIVVNIHDVKTIIMFRGRNYRQPKNLIPINTLTKRKVFLAVLENGLLHCLQALFKARFEQALDSQKLNIKKIEQQLRRMGVNPEDPVAMASIQRVASTFFRAIDEKQGSPYVFQGETKPIYVPDSEEEPASPSEDSDQEELDRFIAEIEEAADKEWEAEEAAEKEEMGRIRYRNDVDERSLGRRHTMVSGEYSEDEMRERDRGNSRGRQEIAEVRKWDGDESDGAAGSEEWDSDGVGDLAGPDSDADGSDDELITSRRDRKVEAKTGHGGAFERSRGGGLRRASDGVDSASSDLFDSYDDRSWQSDDEEEYDDAKVTKADDYNQYLGSSQDIDVSEDKDFNVQMSKTPKQTDETWDSD